MRDLVGHPRVADGIETVRAMVSLYEIRPCKTASFYGMDIILNPMLDGYRGIHLVHEYVPGTLAEFIQWHADGD